MPDPIDITNLSDHAAVITRSRKAKGCVIVVCEEDGTSSVGVFCDGAGPGEIQDALCAAIVENANDAGRRNPV